MPIMEESDMSCGLCIGGATDGATAMALAGFVLSGRRRREGIAARVAAGYQPQGRALPQLIPDGMLPDEHLAVALGTQHPCTWEPVMFPPVKVGLDNQDMNAERACSLVRKCRG